MVTGITKLKYDTNLVVQTARRINFKPVGS